MNENLSVKSLQLEIQTRELEYTKQVCCPLHDGCNNNTNGHTYLVHF
jgi:hypothetical protein